MDAIRVYNDLGKELILEVISPGETTQFDIENVILEGSELDIATIVGLRYVGQIVDKRVVVDAQMLVDFSMKIDLNEINSSKFEKLDLKPFTALDYLIKSKSMIKHDYEEDLDFEEFYMGAEDILEEDTYEAFKTIKLQLRKVVE